MVDGLGRIAGQSSSQVAASPGVPSIHADVSAVRLRGTVLLAESGRESPVVLPGDEIHHAPDGVGPIHCRSAVQLNIHTLNCRQRHVENVDEAIFISSQTGHSPAVDQHRGNHDPVVVPRDFDRQQLLQAVQRGIDVRDADRRDHAAVSQLDLLLFAYAGEVLFKVAVLRTGQEHCQGRSDGNQEPGRHAQRQALLPSPRLVDPLHGPVQVALDLAYRDPHVQGKRTFWLGSRHPESLESGVRRCAYRLHSRRL